MKKRKTQSAFTAFPTSLNVGSSWLLGNSLMGFPGRSMAKNLPANAGSQVCSLGQEGRLEKKMVAHSSILVGESSWTEEPDRLQSMGSEKSQT